VNRDPFGNLRDWKTVLDQLDNIETKGVLAEYQRTIIRVLRFKKNWQTGTRQSLLGAVAA